ncbi:MAG: TolC family protein [Rhizomicrobium sp.]
MNRKPQRRSLTCFIQGAALGALLCVVLPSSADAAAPQGPGAPALTIREAVQRALAASPRLDAVRAGIGAAAGTELQTHLLPNPELSVEAENIIGTGPYRGLSGSEFTYGVAQLIELGGKREARQQAAAANRRAAETELSAAQLDLVRDVTLAYMDVVAAEENVRLAKNLEGTARSVFADVSRRVAAARDPLFQRSRAEVALTNATIARARAEAALLTARQKLGRYWGEPIVAEPLAGNVFFIAEAPEALADYEAELKDAPDLARFARLREAREADLALARAGAAPDVRASLGVRQFAGRDAALVAGVSIPIPVFNQNEGEIARAGAEVTRISSERRQVELERSQQLVDAWGRWKSAFAEIKSLKDAALPQAQRAFTLALAGYRVGGFQYLDVLDTQRALFETRGALNAALTRLHAARTEVERLTAHGSSDIAGSP